MMEPKDVRSPATSFMTGQTSGCCGHHDHHAFGGARSAFRGRLPPDHVLAVLMDEHVRILAQLDQLERLAADLPSAGGMVFARIESIGHQLLAAEPHHQREEQVLFPALRERGIDGPPNVMEAEHVELRALKHQIVDLAAKSTMGDTLAIQPLRAAAHALVSTLRAHIEKEDSILYPMAFATIPDHDWTGLSARCDAIGYCCHHKT